MSQLCDILFVSTLAAIPNNDLVAYSYKFKSKFYKKISLFKQIVLLFLSYYTIPLLKKYLDTSKNSYV